MAIRQMLCGVGRSFWCVPDMSHTIIKTCRTLNQTLMTRGQASYSHCGDSGHTQTIEHTATPQLPQWILISPWWSIRDHVQFWSGFLCMCTMCSVSYAINSNSPGTSCSVSLSLQRYHWSQNYINSTTHFNKQHTSLTLRYWIIMNAIEWSHHRLSAYRGLNAYHCSTSTIQSM